MAKKRSTAGRGISRRRKAQPLRSDPKKMFDGRERLPLVEPLRKWMRAYGSGSEADYARSSFARRVGTSVPYLTQLGLGYRKASPELAIAIERHTHGLVRCEVLCPQLDWAYAATRAKLFITATEGAAPPPPPAPEPLIANEFARA